MGVRRDKAALLWKRSHGRTSEAPPDERGGYRYVRPTATASHLDSTRLARRLHSIAGTQLRPRQRVLMPHSGRLLDTTRFRRRRRKAALRFPSEMIRLGY